MFLIDLLQDVGILRPLVFMASRDFGFETLLLVSRRFQARDSSGIWMRELTELSSQSRAAIAFFSDQWEANQHLTGQGILFTASESHLPQHRTTHDILRGAPPAYLRATLQHGFECVGLRHSSGHVYSHGETASFAADLICSWTDLGNLPSVAPSQQGKLLVTGPTSVLQRHAGPRPEKAPHTGIVCENLHSVRFKGALDCKLEFLAAFTQFSKRMAARKRRVSLRTHPGGQYVVRNKIALPPNVSIEDAPLYRLDLRRFGYGISAPSSVLIDMLLADLPTAVWCDERGEVDIGSYSGLPTVKSARQWIEFARAAEHEPETFLDAQTRFLAASGMPLDPREVFERFAQLFRAVGRMEIRPRGAVAERERILLIASSDVPTLQVSFTKPLASLVARGEIAMRLLTEQDLRGEPTLPGNPVHERKWMGHYLDSYNPSAVVFCRYSGPAFQPVFDWAARSRVPVIYQIDDDLLSVPPEIGRRKYEFHNAPSRVNAVTEMLNSADLIYASTDRLRRRLIGDFDRRPIICGDIYCSGQIMNRPVRRHAQRVGYMASADHAHNLEMVVPAIERLLERNPQLNFELFGAIPMPPQLQRFGDRVSTCAPIADYDVFLQEFAKRRWDIGICPLAPIEFNLMKANTKWVEYTSAAVAVVASGGTAYDGCCADGCGILAGSIDEWFSALDLLANNVDERIALVERAQAKLQREYSLGRLREQLLSVIAQAHAAVGARRGRNRTEKEVRVCQLQ